MSVASNFSSGVAAKAVRRLARMPFGGSLVILMPFCSTDTGNLGEGIEVSQRRKAGSVLSGLMSSTSFSSAPIQLT